MTWKLCLQAGGKALTVAMALGAIAVGQYASAAGPYYYNRPNCPCPPGHPGYRAPGQPGMAAPGTTAPGATTPGAESSPSDAAQTPDAQQQQQQQQQPQQQQAQPDFSQQSEAQSSQADLGQGANTPMLGRNDVSNRLNLFDNMSAAVRNRVWFGFQFASDFNAQLVQDPAFYSASSSFTFDLDNTLYSNLGIRSDFFFAQQSLYRVGAEAALFDDFSVSVQGQYVTPDGGQEENWTNPQIMLKYMLAYDCDSVLSATLGVTPETGTGRGDIDEATTKIYPGLLFYETLCTDVFSQGGFQFGIPVRDNNVTTFDWSLSLGYWLYRDTCNCGHSFITGIAPQINLLGKHVVGDNQIINPYGLVIDSGIPGFIQLYDSFGVPVPGGTIAQTTANNILIYNEGRDILDLTAGATILIGQSVQVGVGYSVPITDAEARKSEFLTSVNFVF